VSALVVDHVKICLTQFDYPAKFGSHFSYCVHACKMSQIWGWDFIPLDLGMTMADALERLLLYICYDTKFAALGQIV